MNQTLGNYQWQDGQFKPNGFSTDKPVSFIPKVLTRERSKVIPKDPDVCLICGNYFDHYRQGKAGLCGRCVLKGLPPKIKVIIESEEDGKKIISYYQPNIIDQLKTEDEENGRKERIGFTRSNDRKRFRSVFRHVKRTDRKSS